MSKPVSKPALHDLDHLIAPASIALIGASSRADTSGKTLFDMVAVDGYAGRVYPVNPKYTEIEGKTCYPSLSELPEVVDHVAIAVGNAQLEDTLEQVIVHGAKAATIFASCLSASEDGPLLSEKLKARARESGVLLCGGNSMGLYNRIAGLRIASFGSSTPLRLGGVAWIVQSGSAISAIAHGDRRLGFTLCVSTGMEFTTTAADYADWALAQDETRVIGMFLESVRDPEKFIRVLERSNKQRIPVVILKVGRTEKSAAMAVSHTGAIAGNDLAFNAICDRYGVIRVKNFNEMIATLQLFDREVAILPGSLATMHDSGGEREMWVDIADDLGVPFATINAETREVLKKNLDVGLVPENPLDAWGTPADAEQRFVNCLSALANDPATGLAFFCTNPRDDYWYGATLQRVIEKAKRGTKTPLAFVNNSSLSNNAKMAVQLADQGIPLINGTVEALMAVRHVTAYRDRFIDRCEITSGDDQKLVDLIQHLSMENGVLSEFEALQLLGKAGITTVDWRQTSDLQQVTVLGTEIGYPLAIKSDEGLLHKSDSDGVRLHLSNEEELRAAYEDLHSRLGPKVIIGPMIPGGIEVGLGAIFDPAFGPIVIISAGGTLIEVLNDKQAAAAPFSETTARRLLEKMRLWPLLNGVRGKPVVNITALCQTIAKLSKFVTAMGPRFSEIDINPIIAGPNGCCAVDALIILSTEV